MRGGKMLKCRRVAIFAATFSIAACGQPPATEEVTAGPCTLPASDVQWIQTLIAEHQAQVLSGDYDAMATSFADDVIMMVPNQPGFTGREKLREFQSAYPPIDEYELNALDIVGCSDLAVVRGTYSMSMAIEGAPEPYTDSGNWMHVLRKQPDGTWAIVMDISNSDRPMSGG